MEFYQQGVAAYKEASYETAADLFSRALHSNPKHVEAYHARAIAYRKLGRVKDGLDDAKVVVKLRPDSHKGYLEGGRLCALAGKTSKAELMFIEARDRVLDKKGALFEAIEEELAQVRHAGQIAQSRPILSLPLEVFLHIIQLALDAYDSRPLPYTSPSSLRRNPLIASLHVCQSWRRSIEAAPTLWSHLRLDADRDGKRVEQKAHFWATRALGITTKDQPSGGGGGRGLRSLTLTRVKSFGDFSLKKILSELSLMGAFKDGLTNLAVSWVDGTGTIATHQRQTELIVRFIVRTSSHSLKGLTIHTDSRLRLGFSLPRFGNTFSSLTSLELKSLAPGASASQTTSVGDIWVPASYLPPYEGEDDWPPMVGMKKLVLVNPIWRLEFQDGTFASPTLSHTDCPNLKEIVLGPTNPPMTFDLFASKGVRRMEIFNQVNPTAMKDPDLRELANSVEELRLVSSSSLASRLLRISLEKGLTFPQLVKLDLKGASFSTTHLRMFDVSNSPFLSQLSLNSTTWLANSDPTNSDVVLPSLPSLKTLDVSDVSWVNSAFISSFSTSAPQLDRLNLDGCSGLPLCMSTLLSFVETKGKGGMKELSMLRCVGVEVTAVSWLREMVRPGGFSHKNAKEQERGWKRSGPVRG